MVKHESSSSYTKGTLLKQLFFLLIFFIKAYMYVVAFELHRQVDTIQMGTPSIYLYKEVDITCTGCNLKTIQLLVCARGQIALM